MAITWAQRLKRVFGIDIDKSAEEPICTAIGCHKAVGYRDEPDETCPTCGGAVRIIACIEDPAVIKTIPSFGPKNGASAVQGSTNVA